MARILKSNGLRLLLVETSPLRDYLFNLDKVGKRLVAFMKLHSGATEADFLVLKTVTIINNNNNNTPHLMSTYYGPGPPLKASTASFHLSNNPAL